MSETAPKDNRPLPTFAVRVADLEEFRRDHLANLSRGCLYLRTDAVVPIDTEVEIILQPPGHTTDMHLRGRVVQITLDQASGESVPAGMTVRLVDLTTDEEVTLAALLDELGLTDGNATSTPEPTDDDAAREAEIARLHARLEGLRVRVSDLQTERDDLAQEDRASRAVVDRLAAQRAKLDVATQNAAHLAGDLAALEARHAELTERLKVQVDDGLRLATEEAEQAYVLQHRQADAFERQAEGLQVELERQVALRREDLTRATSELAALEEQSTQAQRLTLEEVEAVRDRLQKAKTAQAAELSAKAAETERQQHERRELDAQMETARKLLAARQTASAELAREVDRAAAQHERLLTKRRDLERLLGMLSSDSQPEMTAPSTDTEAAPTDDIDVDIGDEPELGGSS